jgi:hypothetical protein
MVAPIPFWQALIHAAQTMAAAVAEKEELEKAHPFSCFDSYMIALPDALIHNSGCIVCFYKIILIRPWL